VPPRGLSFLSLFGSLTFPLQPQPLDIRALKQSPPGAVAHRAELTNQFQPPNP